MIDALLLRVDPRPSVCLVTLWIAVAFGDTVAARPNSEGTRP